MKQDWKKEEEWNCLACTKLPTQNFSHFNHSTTNDCNRITKYYVRDIIRNSEVLLSVFTKNNRNKYKEIKNCKYQI